MCKGMINALLKFGMSYYPYFIYIAILTQQLHPKDPRKI